MIRKMGGFLIFVVLASCGASESETGTSESERNKDRTPPKLTEISQIGVTTDYSPRYEFNSTEEGLLEFEGDCSSEDRSVVTGYNSVTLIELEDGVYSDCGIIVTDNANNSSERLLISSFEILDTRSPVFSIQDNYRPYAGENIILTINTNEDAYIEFEGSCRSAINNLIEGENNVPLESLELGYYKNCSFSLMDDSGNKSDVFDLGEFEVIDYLIVKKENVDSVGEVTGRTETQYASDGRILNEFIDDDGDYFFEETSVYTYDPLSKKLTTLKVKDQLSGLLLSNRNYYYDIDGRYSSYEQDTDGNGEYEIVSTHSYDPITKILRTDNNIKQIEFFEFNEDDLIVRWQFLTVSSNLTRLTEYNVDNQITLVESFNSHVPYRREDFTYLDGNLIQRDYDSNYDGVLEQIDYFEYNENNLLIEKRVWMPADGIYFVKLKYEYNTLGQKIKEYRQYNHSSEYKLYYSWKYNAYGNISESSSDFSGDRVAYEYLGDQSIYSRIYYVFPDLTRYLTE